MSILYSPSLRKTWNLKYININSIWDNEDFFFLFPVQYLICVSPCHAVTFVCFCAIATEETFELRLHRTRMVCDLWDCDLLTTCWNPLTWCSAQWGCYRFWTTWERMHGCKPIQETCVGTHHSVLFSGGWVLGIK